MHIYFNLRHLEENNVHLKGEMSPADLELEGIDEVIHVRQPLKYDLEVQKMEQAVLVQGRLSLNLDCECVRCLRAFQHHLEINPWNCHIPLEGEEKAVVVNDLVDLTPYVREDIVLALPQHPLCGPGCRGLAALQKTEPNQSVSTTSEPGVSPWAALDKLKL